MCRTMIALIASTIMLGCVSKPQATTEAGGMLQDDERSTASASATPGPLIEVGPEGRAPTMLEDDERRAPTARGDRPRPLEEPRPQ